jgi:hypothetical protein
VTEKRVNMPIKVKAKLDEQNLSDYTLYSIYYGKVGIVSVILGFLDVAFMLSFFSHKKYFLAVLALLFILVIFVIVPFIMNTIISKKSKKSKMLEVVATYEFDEDGITTTTDYDSGKASWKRFVKVMKRKGVLVIKADTGQNILIPIEQIGERYWDLIDLFHEKMPVTSVRIMSKPPKK